MASRAHLRADDRNAFRNHGLAPEPQQSISCDFMMESNRSRPCSSCSIALASSSAAATSGTLGRRRKARNNRQDMIPKCCQFPRTTILIAVSSLRPDSSICFRRQVCGRLTCTASFRPRGRMLPQRRPSDLSDVPSRFRQHNLLHARLNASQTRQLQAAVRSACCFSKMLRGANGSVPGRDQHHRTECAAVSAVKFPDHAPLCSVHRVG
jgi:hypothetical protein